MNIVAVTACSTGIAQTYIAADVLKYCARVRGHKIKVETQGALGINNPITSTDLGKADLVIITNDVPIDNICRFDGVTTISVAIDDIIRDPQKVIDSLS